MTNPFTVALFRAALGAIMAGATVFMATWSTTNDVKTITIATLGAMISYIVSRGGIEGVFDQRTKPDMNVPPATDLDNLGTGV